MILLFQRLKTFWTNFWYALKSAYNKAFRDIPKEKVQNYRDTQRINFLAIFVTKLNNLANTEATFGIESDSTQAEKLKELCENLEENRFEITADMLGDGDLWVFPAHDSNGDIYHRFVPQDRVRILNIDGENITDLIGIIDDYVSGENKVYFLNRRHTLNGNTLTIQTYITNEKNEPTTLEEWAELESTYQINGVNTIGVGRFKSPVSSRGKSSIYGVPLNFGCEEIEEKIFSDLEQIETEFSRAESKIFADPLIMRKGKDKVGNDTWQIPEGMYPIDTRGGTSGASIDIFSPTIRYSEYRAKLVDDLAQYEQQVGTDKGFLTPFESISATTATEIRRANASTIALIDKIHTAIKKGIDETIKADAMLLNVADDLYTIVVDWYDPFADENAQYQRIASAVDRGIAEKIDEMRWLFPNLSPEELEEKLARIDEYKLKNSQQFFVQGEGDEEKDNDNSIEQSDQDERTEEEKDDDKKKQRK